MNAEGCQRTFLDWSRPVLPAVADHLISAIARGAVWDLSEALVLVPTREAGRRLREALAYRAHQADTGLFPPHVWPAYRLVTPDTPGTATALQMRLVFTHILGNAAPDAYPALFPAGLGHAEDDHDRFALAFRAAQPLCELRSLLTEGGLRFADVAPALGEGFEDAERWGDLERLEMRYLQRLEELKLQDPLDAAIQTAEAPAPPNGVRRVVVAAVPDLPTLVQRALDRILHDLPVEILVHAPADKADLFDPFGRPDVPQWQEYELPLDDGQIELLADAPDQAAHVRELLRPLAETNALPPGSVTVGVPDETVTPPLREALSDCGCTAFDPTGIPLLRHPLCRLVQHLAALTDQDRYENASRLLRHPDVLDALLREEAEAATATTRILRDADQCQNDHLPVTFTAFAESAGIGRDGTSRELEPAVLLLRRAVNTVLEGVTFCEGLRGALAMIYEDRTLSANSPRDREFQTVARVLAEQLDIVDTACRMGLLPAARDQLAVLSQALQSGRYYFPEPGDDVPDVELQGWLELHWNDAPQLILTGFNDHVVPESVVGHAFLPDSVRTRLALTDNERRFARDTYLLQAMLASRSASPAGTPARENHGPTERAAGIPARANPPENAGTDASGAMDSAWGDARGTGGVRIVLGKQSADGDVLRPSRLLFQCAPEVLPGRALRLFGSADQTAQAPPWQRTWRLRPPPLTEAVLPSHLRVTDFRTYLSCPFRFYLKRVLGMEARDDRKRELDAMDFGTLCHQALKAFGRHCDLRNARDADKIAAYLTEVARRAIERQYGTQLPVAVMIQMDSILQRLRAAAEQQAALREEGWEIIAAEVPLAEDRASRFSPLPIRGVIDRIDRHPDGRFRLLDYKTTDSPQNPRDAHWGPVRDSTPEHAATSDGRKKRAWKDLQLPLYALLCTEIPDEQMPECGYFNLPKATTQTGVALWEGLGRTHLQDAKTCAGAIAQAIRDGRFWPPAERVLYDDFQSLFFESPADSFEPLQVSR